MELKRINIATLLNDPNKEAYYDFYVELNKEKRIQYGKKEYNNYEALESLKNKFDYVLLTQESYDRYILRKSVVFEDTKNFDIKEKQKVIEEFLKDKELLSSVLSDVGVLDEEKVSFIEDIKEKNITFIKNIESLGSLFELYNQNNNHSIVKKQMEIYIITNLLYKAKKFKEETINDFVKGLILCDLLLEEKEYWIAQKGIGKQFTKKLRNHADDLLEKIPTKTFPPYVISFIKDHHELPDGKGYPSGKKCHEVNFFTALYVIVEDFVSQLLINKCKTNKYTEIINKIKSNYEEYLDTEYEVALDVFLKNISQKYIDFKKGGQND